MRALLFACLVVCACGHDKPKNATMCAPFTELNLPSITRLDQCTSTALTGETTASPDEFAKAFVAAGYEVGRDVKDRNHTKEKIWFRRGNEAYAMSAEFETIAVRKHPYFSIRKDTPGTWMSEASWQKVGSIPAAEDKMEAALRVAGELFTPDATAPKKCPPLDELDPMLATSAQSILVNLEGANYRAEGARGPKLLAESPSFASPEEMASLIEEYAKHATRRIVPVLRITSYVAPEATDSDVRAGTFKPGSAAFDVGVVDVVEKKVLCRSSASAVSSASIRGTTTTYKNADGSTTSSSGANADGDLGSNMRSAAFAELAKMSPVFASQ